MPHLIHFMSPRLRLYCVWTLPLLKNHSFRWATTSHKIRFFFTFTRLRLTTLARVKTAPRSGNCLNLLSLKGMRCMMEAWEA